jgi:hypothetical protein
MSKLSSATTIASAITRPGPPRSTGSSPSTESLVRAALDEIALLIGGAAALHRLDDDLVWTLMKRMDRVRVRLLRDLKGDFSSDQFEPPSPTPPRVHGAVEEFLVRNRAGMGE